MKIVAILSYFAIKKVSYVEKLYILWSAEDSLEIFLAAKFFSLLHGPQAKKVWETLVYIFKHTHVVKIKRVFVLQTSNMK
jgi:hypothetical protein